MIHKYRPITLLLLSYLAVFVFSHKTAFASDKNLAFDDASNGRLSVFLDCPWWCDTDFIREIIPLVDYVRDKELAQVHIIMNRHGGGNAGTTYTISFFGMKQFAGMFHELEYWAPSTNTADANRRGYTEMLKIGLAPYIVRTNMAQFVKVNYSYDPKRTEKQAAPVKDPWNNWVFEIYGGGNFSKEEKNSNMSFRWGGSAEKVTHEWKIRIRPYFNYSERTFITTDATIKRESHRNGFNGHLIKSINDHWSAGLMANMLSSTFHNMNFNIEINPAIEFSLFPYREATKRSITFAYRMGYGYHDYIAETIFMKTEEYLFGHSIEANVRFQQPWGTMRAGLSGSHYFHDFSANRATFNTNLNLRLFQGFSLSLSGNFDLINDLVSIPKGNMSIEDILLQQRRQATSYQMSGSIGLSYTFGSRTTGVYNPRL